ncbi:hypothetical protein [Devosia psychrophila]|uniref:Uncharacterized protein n=1 Tax=Devosia psychrophila TaxID=728005 RepID=A0A0F5Q1U6_9HYPH|nr:hypothetical protein [Devosia psychrophila]KKC34596.1 hypothetical protein WH91_01720 [Devosia psychrophila]SFD00250.1 hypothetical protein SAMN04488059_11724 [Devosia psychrophila]
MNAAFLRPAGCPCGIASADWRNALLERIESQAAVLTALVDALDAMEGDADCEPWLGANEPTGSAIGQLHWSSGPDDSREDENEHGGDVQDEPHDDINEGCPADEMPIHGRMTEDQKDEVWDEGERLVAQARAMLPPPVVLQFPGHRP